MNPFSDLERIAIQFATELRAAAKQTGNIGERSLNDLRDILTDTLAKVRTEVFGDTGSAGRSGDNEHDVRPEPGPADAPSGQADAPSGQADAPSGSTEAAAGPEGGAATGPSADADGNAGPGPGTP